LLNTWWMCDLTVCSLITSARAISLALVAALEADLGPARKSTRARLLRPLLRCAAIVPLFIKGWPLAANSRPQ
jgi:hypothetical protein